MNLDRKLGQCPTASCSSVHTWTRWSLWSLFKRRRTKFAAIRLMFSSSARMRCHVPYYSPTRLQTPWIIWLLSSSITSHTFAIICGVVHVDVRPEYLSFSTLCWPFLKRLKHTDISAWLKACSRRASFSIRCVSDAVLLSLKQNLRQVRCSLIPDISVIADLVKMV